MNIFDIIKYKSKTLPEEYIVSRKRIGTKRQTKIKAKNIISVYISDKPYHHINWDVDTGEVNWGDNVSWRLFIHKNFNKLTQVDVIGKTYYLKKGLLHNIKSYAYTKNNEFYWFIKGKEVEQKYIIETLRENKLKRILSLID